jgi:hypothetical protein
VVDARKLVDQFVAAGMLTRDQADKMIANSLVPAGGATPLAAASPSTVVAGGTDGDSQTIPYIPAPVIAQIKSEVRAEDAQQAKAEGWGQPNLIPDWLGKVRLEGDIRVRDEEDMFNAGNDPNLVNFNAINTGAPFNLNRNVPGSANPPFLNSTEDRNRPRVRARFGLIAQPDDWISFEIRAAAGNDSSPVSQNQTLGSTGDFSKYGLWLDRAVVSLTPHWGLLDGLRVDLGRGENPFWTSPLLFYPDLNFDGFSGRYRHDIPGVSNLEGFGTLGAFPIFNTALNFGSNDVGAFASRDEWMLAGQVGATYKPTSDIKLTAAAAYFDFSEVGGKLSSPCLFNQDVCDSDNSRTPFEQFGNSVTPIRNIIADPSVGPGLSADPQYFGLASNFRVLDIHTALDFTGYANFPVRLEGDFIDNLAFNKSEVLAKQINVVGPYDPGNIGWTVNLTVGKPVIERLGDWNASIGYRYLETDATLDAIADADFHIGGTNAKGFVLMGYYGIAKNTSIGIRWFSADVVTGPRYSNDVLQFDLNTKF